MGINLSQTSAAARAQKNHDKMFTRGVWIGMLLLIITASSYAALRIYDKTLHGTITGVENKILQLEEDTANAKMVDVANAVFRVRDIEQNTSDNSAVLLAMESVAANVIDVVVLDSYSYEHDNDGTMVSLEMSTPDLLAIARQLEVLKNTEGLTDVTVKNISRDPKTSVVTFTIEFSLAKKM